MTRLLYVKASPRGQASKTIQIADAFAARYRDLHPRAAVEEIDLWQAGLPEFDGDSAATKMSFFGEPAMTEAQQAVYRRIVAIFEQFNAADDYLFAVPMWNFGVPYKLKQYIDILSMPGTLFGFEPAKGYIGLLQNKRATAVYSAGIWSPGVSKAYGTDYTSTHLGDWLNFAGVRDVVHIWYPGYKMIGADDAEAALAEAKRQARAAAERPALAAAS